MEQAVTFGERYRDAIETGTQALLVGGRSREVLLAATVEIPCPVCGGTGGYVDAGSEPSPCLLCGGSGVLRVLPQNGES
jgi:DnaJ-class molecular chaperone